MPELNDDGSLNLDAEIEALVVATAEESERRGSDFLGGRDPGEALGHAAGFDGSILARLAIVCAEQQRQIADLQDWAEKHHRSGGH